jgi:hypothetical protein
MKDKHTNAYRRYDTDKRIVLNQTKKHIHLTDITAITAITDQQMRKQKRDIRKHRNGLQLFIGLYIFCGKMISYKEDHSRNHRKKKKREDQTDPTDIENPRKTHNGNHTNR